MRQWILPQSYDGSEHLKITGADSRYLLRVLRLKEGAEFPAVDRNGQRYILTITETGKDYLNVKCSISFDEISDSETGLILIQCLPKGKKLEMIVRQATEAGTDLIIPASSENSVPVIKEERSGKKRERLLKIAEEAAQQSGNPGLPAIMEPVELKKTPELLNKLGFSGVKLFFHQDRLAKGSLHRYVYESSDSVCILIGPEGGLSPEETDFLLASGFLPVYLGENVLRTETAAIYALGAVKTILLEKKEWTTDIRK